VLYLYALCGGGLCGDREALHSVGRHEGCDLGGAESAVVHYRLIVRGVLFVVGSCEMYFF
jgi:hypothetical protein